MSNLAKSQAEWLKLYRELGLFLAVAKKLDDDGRKFDPTRNRVQVLEENSINGLTSAWTLAGVVFGTNTDEDGHTFCRILGGPVPTVTPTFARVAGGGAITIGSHVVAYTLYNSVTGGESAPSILSNSITMPDSTSQGTLSATLPTAPTGVDTVRIYMTKAGTTFPIYYTGASSAYATSYSLTFSVADAALVTAPPVGPTVSLYKAAGGSGGNLVAQGQAAIPGPTAPVFARVAGGGGITIGTHVVAYTLFNSVTLAESAPSVISNSINMPDSTSQGTLSVTLPAAVNGVDKVRIYMSTAGTTTPLWFTGSTAAYAAGAFSATFTASDGVLNATYTSLAPTKTTVTLAAQNASGLTGTVAIGVLTLCEVDDQHRLRIYPDWVLRARAVFDGSKPEHGALYTAFLGSSIQISRSLASARNTMVAALNVFLFGRLANFLGSSQSTAIDSGLNSPSAGVVATAFSGLLEDLRADMVDEATAGAQTVATNAVAATAGTPDTHNVGVGSLAPPVMAAWAVTGTITMVCFDSTVGAEKFLVSMRDTLNNVIQAEAALQVECAFASPALGIVNMLLSRTLSISPGSSADFATINDWTIVGESPQNSSGGSFFLRCIVNPLNGAQFATQGWTTPTFATGTQVFQTDYGVANAVVNVNAVGGSGLSGLSKIGTAPTNLNTGTLKLQCFVTANNSTPAVPDKWTIQVTRSTTGEFADKLAELYDYAVNGTTLGSQTIPEGYVTAGTFPPYSVRDA